MENLIRRRVLWRLIWFCTVCRCPTKRTLGLYGLKWDIFLAFFIFSMDWSNTCWIGHYAAELYSLRYLTTSSIASADIFVCCFQTRSYTIFHDDILWRIQNGGQGGLDPPSPTDKSQVAVSSLRSSGTDLQLRSNWAPWAQLLLEGRSYSLYMYKIHWWLKKETRCLESSESAHVISYRSFARYVNFPPNAFDKKDEKEGHTLTCL